MKLAMIGIVIWIVLLTQTCSVDEPKVHSVVASGTPEALTTQSIGRDRAIAIANKAALRVHGSLADFNVVACEQSVFWAVIYDGDNSEYLIDKASGKIIEVRRVPQGLEDPDHKAAGPPKSIEGISEVEAGTIAKSNFRLTYGTDADKNLILLPCELAKVWRIVLDVKLPETAGQSMPVIPDGHAPTYVIDKKTREVLYRQIY